MMNTAEYRKAAAAAAKELNWMDAAILWGKAIAAYPKPESNLSRHDLSIMKVKMDACAWQVRNALPALAMGV